MPLTTTEAQEIADLFSDITVATMMLETDKGSLRKYLSLARRAEATIALSDKFGINLCTLDLSREHYDRYRRMARDLMEAGNSRTYPVIDEVSQ